MPEPIVLYEGEDEVRIPARNEICPRCEGDGTHDAWDGGMTADEMREMGEDFRDDYLAGRYSVPCTECAGRRVVAVPDESRATPAQLAAWEEHQQCLAEDRAIARAERMMGA